MKISIVQTDVVYKDQHQNLLQVAQLLSETQEVGDVILLPELFSTGYIFDSPQDIHELCEEYQHSPTIETLQQLAATYQSVIVAGIAEHHEGRFYNSVAVIDRTGLQHRYRKISQTNIDKQYFSRGDSLMTFEYQGCVFGVAICFDLWFPEITREYAISNVDVLLHPANFGGEQSLLLSRTKAIENHCYVATCNRVGIDKTQNIVGEYCGNSQVISPSGEILAQLKSVAAVETIELSKIETKKVIGVDLISEIGQIEKKLK
ncbi:carbon-nitrogen hydrolase family protein [Vibrio sp. SCSIO 43133]|uniref:carbon-nitrogen hydrolase family protein n=1 Tax=Vibrio sp. SCSIO 43133 TaxID=2802577 RepID=UPI002075ACA4|nr:carbon-nitrogen hydrolase family protein [Vibrio sp. SCSIO 43133]USE03372.1 carbon-nitrogen hydrolase family protein [Vibrio sp. SCSIO 43133]